MQFHSLKFIFDMQLEFEKSEVETMGNDERPDDYAQPVKDLGFALMNAGIRVNLNEANTLKNLASSKKLFSKNPTVGRSMK